MADKRYTFRGKAVPLFRIGGTPVAEYSLALELMSYIKRQMEIHDLYRNYTMQEFLDELDTIEYYQQPGRAHHLSEITEKQRKLYEMMGVDVPT